MAGTTTISVSYAGEASTGFVSAALLEGKTLQSGKHVTVVDGIKYKQAINKLDMANLVQRGDCDFEDSGDLTLTEAILEPVPFKVNKKECVRNFLPHWASAKMKKGDNNSDMVPFNQFIIEQIGANVAKEVETMIWRNKYDATGTTNATAFDGFLQILKSGSAIDVSGTTFSKANIGAQFEAAYNAIPSQILSKGNVKFYANKKTIGFYLQSEAGRETMRTSGEVAELRYLDVEILETPGLPDNIILAAEPSNLFVGVDLASDQNEVSIIDRKPIDGSDNFYYVLKFTLDVAIAYPSEVVFLGENQWS